MSYNIDIKNYEDINECVECKLINRHACYCSLDNGEYDEKLPELKPEFSVHFDNLILELEKRVPKDNSNFLRECINRRKYINEVGFCLITKIALDYIATYILEFGGKMLSVGSGDLATVECMLGFYKGIEIFATDDFSSYGSEERRQPFISNGQLMNSVDPVNTVHDLDAVEAVRLYIGNTDLNIRVIFFGWPCMSSMAVDTIREFEKVYKQSGRTEPIAIIYWGEQKEGCTADNEFFDELEENWKYQGCFATPQWPDIYDGLEVYTIQP